MHLFMDPNFPTGSQLSNYFDETVKLSNSSYTEMKLNNIPIKFRHYAFIHRSYFPLYVH